MTNIITNISIINNDMANISFLPNAFSLQDDDQVTQPYITLAILHP